MFAPHSEIAIFNQQHPTQTKTLLVEACSELDPISQDDDEDWIIQCKIVHHRAKPAKTKEYKVQFHPSAWEQNDEEFEKHIVKAVQKAIHDSYGSHWQLALPYSEEDVTKVLKELKETKGEVKLSRKTVTVDWLLDPSQSDHLARCAHFLSTLTVSVTSEDKEQIVRVTTAANQEKAWFSVKFRFENEPGLYESSGKNHKLVLIPGIDGSESALVRLVLKRVVYSYDPEHEICPVWFYGEVRSEMNLVCRQKEITRLMKELDQSWEQLDHRSITPSRVISGDEFVDFSRIGVSQAHDLVPVEPKPSSSHRKPTKASEPPCVSSLCPKSILKTPISKVKNSKQIEFLKSTQTDDVVQVLDQLEIDDFHAVAQEYEYRPPLKFNQYLKQRTFQKEESIATGSHEDSQISLAAENEKKALKCIRSDCDAVFRNEKMLKYHMSYGHFDPGVAAEMKEQKARNNKKK